MLGDESNQNIKNQTQEDLSDEKEVTCQSSDHRGGGQGRGQYSSGVGGGVGGFIVSSQGIGPVLWKDMQWPEETKRGI